MTTPEEHISRLASVTLTESERSMMRARLLAYTHLHPAQASRPVRLIRWVLRHGAATLALVGLLAVGGVGVSAESSRPGDVLYGFRLLVNDKVQMALAADEDARIDVEMLQLQRMIDDEEFLRDDVLGDLAYQDMSDADDPLRDELDAVEHQLDELDDDRDAASERVQASDAEADAFERELSDMERELRELEREDFELE